MLRDFQYNSSASQLTEVLRRFNLDFATKNTPLDVLRFEVLSPDSFMWKLLLNNTVYYLYAEDYISGLDYVEDIFNEYLGNNKWVFVQSREALNFESSSPVESADVYEKPSQAEDLMNYAVDSGHDFVFLVKTLENPDEAHFPRKRN
jgi:hypothetical protein